MLFKTNSITLILGAQSDSEVNSVSPSEGYTDRGYVSDGELYDAQSKVNRCPSPLEVRPVPENGSWLLVSLLC